MIFETYTTPHCFPQDPNTSVEIAGGLYNDTLFVDSVFNGLTDEGVVSSFWIEDTVSCTVLLF